MFPTASLVITANPGGGQTSAAALGPDFNRVTTVATVGDSVKLPVATSPVMCVVANAGANSMQVFGSGTDTVNGVSGSTGIPQLAGSVDIYFCVAPGQWMVESGLGFSGGFPTISSANAIVATPGGTQGTSLQLSAAISRITTVATVADAVKLPLAAPGMQLIVCNASANSMGIFPSAGDAVNALGANAVYSLVAGKTAEFYAASGGFWHAVLSA